MAKKKLRAMRRAIFPHNNNAEERQPWFCFTTGWCKRTVAGGGPWVEYNTMKGGMQTLSFQLAIQLAIYNVQ
ncbi:MAG: hypothetical protein LUD78_09900 [Clostridiales bacterium]|nr:hypothetical protein [Clostridiales bacterium]